MVPVVPEGLGLVGVVMNSLLDEDCELGLEVTPADAVVADQL